MSLLISFGTRPEEVKLKPVIDLFGNKARTLFTGQHEDLAKLKYDYAFTVEERGNRLDSIVSSIMNGLDYILSQEPWITHVMVQGDTTSAAAMAISAFHHGLKVVHLEAGLRTWDLTNPYPEEANRRIISQITDLHLCPTIDNMMNLTRLGGRKYVVGNTVIDTLTEYKNKCDYKDIVLITMHRRENHKLIHEWFESFNEVARRYPELKFIFIKHPNPNISNNIHLLEGIKVIDPLERDKFLKLLTSVKAVITDSGGLQEECSYFNKLCFVCRQVTERMESVGISSFMVRSPEILYEVFSDYIDRYEINAKCPYGDGNSAKLIYDILMTELDGYSADS